jgi:uroporphyrinogen-III synthase
LITRAQAQAAIWVHDLAAQGIAAQALPLIAVQALDDLQGVRQAWAQLAAYRAVMFVSANAVRYFFCRSKHGVSHRARVCQPNAARLGHGAGHCERLGARWGGGIAN